MSSAVGHAAMACLSLAIVAASGAELVTSNFESAGISRFLADWDKPAPGARTVDAANRAVLLRFPGAAEKLWAEAAKGQKIAKAEVVLTYEGYELSPKGYICRYGLGEKKWKENPPQWHIVAWPLRLPWKADAKTGPTFNAFAAGGGYWTKYGAGDARRDRFPTRLGPAELSTQCPEGRLDVTSVLNDPAYGKSLGERLRLIEQCGLLLKKLETHDFRYDEWWSAYEWANPTGGHGLTFKDARLVVTFAPGDKPEGTLPKATDTMFLAWDSYVRDTKPTAMLPSPEQLQAMAAKHAFTRPAWMPDWQWQRVSDLATHPGDRIGAWRQKLLSGDPADYAKVVAELLSIPPRFWQGWGIQDDLLLWYLYRDMLPEPVLDSIREYWDAWLMPDIPTDQFFHAQSQKNDDYWKATKDWRGRKSFFRDGYNYVISTMNFNHTAAMGALLGGHIIGSERAMADGRHGLEHLPLRLWAWYDGTTQESIDHYYFSITLSGQKMFADFGPTHLDRLMGQSILAKSVEELTSSWHPNLRRFINTSGRTGLSFLWATQGGLEHIIHTLSRRGAMHDADNKDLFGMPRFNLDAPAGRIALQTINGPWAPEWAANMVDEKPLPYEMTVTQKDWGHFAQTPLWKRCYLGKHYGLASTDVGRFGSVPVMAQWQRTKTPVEKLQEVGTLLVRYGMNTTKLLTQGGGVVPMQGGSLVTLQHKSKMVLLSSPLCRLGEKDKEPPEVKSLQTTIALFTFEPPPTWEFYVDGERIKRLPVAVKAGQRIALKDGVSWVGLIPLPSTDLGRDAEVVISADGVEEELQGGGKAKPTLLIQQYNYRSATPLAKSGKSWEEIDQAYGGFIIEVSDETEQSFRSFQRHLRRIETKTRWDAEKKTLHVLHKSGSDTFEFGYRPEYQVFFDKGVPTDQCFPYRVVNGKWPYLVKGLDRDSTLTQQGTTGRLEKNGAVLTCEPGRMAYLQTEPLSGTYAGLNPLPSPTLWSLSVPGGMTITADGRVSMLRVIAQPKQNKLTVDYAVKGDQNTPDMATALLVFGPRSAPSVELNGKPAAGTGFQPVGGKRAFVIPLADGPVPNGLEERLRRAREALGAAAKEGRGFFLHDWHVAGPFAVKDDERLWAGVKATWSPEQGVDLKATYAGMNRVDGKEVEVPIRWQRALKPGQPPMGPGPVSLAELMAPTRGACAFAYTRIVSDRDREVTLYTGSDQCLAVWLNGQKVLERNLYRAAEPDQDKTKVALKKGENTVLLRSIGGWEGWSFYFRLGDDYGFPITEGLTFGLGNAQ
ncbi:MAG TPA: hypothetical protein PLE19_04640 [Planctomycetota bacterium]|nr:hypothetical protein [Planctomycetota bacterium]HRR79075.1 hypothetical protein [Planctomycetota bacterium]HRT93025.1 hypothetical protein [Planctomycetota bacterium]